MATIQQSTIRVTQRFNANPDQVFDAWVNPATISLWMFRGEELVRLLLDARPGGKYSFLVRRDGQDIDHTGEYFAVARPSRLGFSWCANQDMAPESSRVTLDIVPIETGSELILNHTLHPDWMDYVSQTEAGWIKMLSSLATLFP